MASEKELNLKIIVFDVMIYLKGCDILLTISDKLKIILNRLDISQKELAKRLGTTQQNLSKKFIRNNWKESDLKQISNVIGIESEIIFKLKDGTII